MASLKINLRTKKVFGFAIFCGSNFVTLFILVEDNEDEDSFENLEEVSALDPSAIVNSFLGTDFERSQVCPQACTKSLADLSDGILVPPFVVFWLFEEILSFPFSGLHFLFFVCPSQSVG